MSAFSSLQLLLQSSKPKVFTVGPGSLLLPVLRNYTSRLPGPCRSCRRGSRRGGAPGAHKPAPKPPTEQCPCWGGPGRADNPKEIPHHQPNARRLGANGTHLRSDVVGLQLGKKRGERWVSTGNVNTCCAASPGSWEFNDVMRWIADKAIPTFLQAPL